MLFRTEIALCINHNTQSLSLESHKNFIITISRSNKTVYAHSYIIQYILFINQSLENYQSLLENKVSFL